MIDDLSRFGVTQKKPTLKNVPKELLDIPAKTVIPKEDAPLPEMKSSEPEKKVRKSPVRSRSK